MINLPDAPWIRMAEMYGTDEPDDEPVYCPMCGCECETIYTDPDGDAVGCECCLCKRDAYDWQADRKRRGA